MERYRKDFDESLRMELEGKYEGRKGEGWKSLRKDLARYSNMGHRRWGSDVLNIKKSRLQQTGSFLALQSSFKPAVYS